MCKISVHIGENLKFIELHKRCKNYVLFEGVAMCLWYNFLTEDTLDFYISSFLTSASDGR
jgi:hypothetical protein